MLTKAIVVERILNTNKYKVRIPFFEQAGISNREIFEATLCHEPSCTEALVKNDVVIVGFEDHESTKPIILGKLFLTENEARGNLNINSLEVVGSATLPMHTTIGGINIYDAIVKLQRLANNNSNNLEDINNKED